MPQYLDKGFCRTAPATPGLLNTPIMGALLKSCKRQLRVTARAGGDCNYVMLVSQDLGLDLLKLPTVNQNKGFIIPTFCRPSADFEEVEDPPGIRLAFVCLYIPR